jgi:hypothetical protein
MHSRAQRVSAGPPKGTAEPSEGPAARLYVAAPRGPGRGPVGGRLDRFDDPHKRFFATRCPIGCPPDSVSPSLGTANGLAMGWRGAESNCRHHDFQSRNSRRWSGRGCRDFPDRFDSRVAVGFRWIPMDFGHEGPLATKLCPVPPWMATTLMRSAVWSSR